MIKFHELKDKLIDELHNRPFPQIKIPAQVSNLVVLHPGDRENELEHITRLANIYKMSKPDMGSTCYYESSDKFDFRWERHSEFSTYTFISDNLVTGSKHTNEIINLDAEWVSDISGEVISANHIDLRSPKNAPKNDKEFNDYFDNETLIGSHIYDGNATVWTSVKSDSNGFNRVILIDEGIDPNQAGRAVRNLLELATYRSMTLLAWPVARALLSDISELEQSLNETGERLKKLETLEDEQKLMAELISEASKVEKLISDNSFRFSAMQAYFKITESRLEMLREQKIPTIRTLKEFHVRRFIPAYDTCMSVVKRKDNLSDRVSRTSELLHSRLQISLEAQNQKLLASMDSRSKVQLRLQQTVEGLSVVAITYYMMGLIRFMVEPLPVEAYLGIKDSWVVGGLTPIILFGVYAVVRRIRKKLKKNS